MEPDDRKRQQMVQIIDKSEKELYFPAVQKKKLQNIIMFVFPNV
jgi:hypothetical protein